MASRAAAHTAFLRHKDALIAQLGRGPLADDVLQALGRAAFGGQWGGCVPWDRVRLEADRFYVVNSASHTGRGVHWLALHTTKKGAYLWDSYSRAVRRVVPRLVRKLEAHGYRLEGTEHHPDQVGRTSEVCGQESLAWLLTVRDLGIGAAAHI